MAPPTDFLLPRFETYSTGENADYGTLLTAVRKSASRDQRFRRRSRTERQSSRPEVVQYELGLSLGIVEDNGWGTLDKSLPLTSR
jgi:hypothetical protein